MPVEIEEGDYPDDIHVKLICEGCGEVIDEHEAFADRKEQYEDMRPIHDSVKCKKKAEAEADNQHSIEEQDEKMVLLGDLRTFENQPGKFDLQIDSKLMSIHTGGSGIHRLTFFREQDARRLYKQLDRVFSDDRDGGEASE